MKAQGWKWPRRAVVDDFVGICLLARVDSEAKIWARTGRASGITRPASKALQSVERRQTSLPVSLASKVGKTIYPLEYSQWVNASMCVYGPSVKVMKFAVGIAAYLAKRPETFTGQEVGDIEATPI